MIPLFRTIFPSTRFEIPTQVDLEQRGTLPGQEHFVLMPLQGVHPLRCSCQSATATEGP